jgi:hypothetical protein
MLNSDQQKRAQMNYSHVDGFRSRRDSVSKNKKQSANSSTTGFGAHIDRMKKYYNYEK